MRNSRPSRLLCLSLSLLFLCSAAAQADVGVPKPVKEWTFLTFINGNNDLDRFGASNINQMEGVGSTDDINIVVQWASYARRTTQRIYVKKDNNPSTVTSPVLQEVSNLDMGDWRQLVEFVRWAHERYPAKRYFINVWNHGTGWHLNDISYDDISGNFISTKDLGLAMKESAAILGQKVDLYGSDACLMAMIEVAAEMKDSVEIFAGSEETEPGDGWPYREFLTRWIKAPTSTPAEVAKILTEEYIRAYSWGVFGKEDVTFSSFDMTRYAELEATLGALSQAIMKISTSDRALAIGAANRATRFAYSDYRDMGMFIDELKKLNLTAMNMETLKAARSALTGFVSSNQATGRYSKVTGVSFWLPTKMSVYTNFSDRYSKLLFSQNTDWSNALKFMLEK